MKFDKPKGGNPVDGPVDGRHPDGTTEAQRANCRAIYEDPEAYAEWRIRMGLSKAPEAMTRASLRPHVAWNSLHGAIRTEPRENARTAKFRSLEELGEYAAKPLAVSGALARANSAHALAQSQLGDADGR
jgi:hypothetical protein